MDVFSSFNLLNGMAFVGVPLLLVTFAVIVFLFFYKKCKPNELLVVYGTGVGKGTSKVIHGGGVLIVPGLQDYKRLSLIPLDYDVNLKDALSSNSIRLDLPVSCTVAIGTTPELSSNAAERLLGLSIAEITSAAKNITVGQLRAAVSMMTIEEINTDREKFLTQINTNIADEISKIGLCVVNINVKDITDQSGYIEAIGKKAASTAVQQARVDVAEQEKRGAIGMEKAKRQQEQEVAIQSARSDEAISKTNAEKTSYVAAREAEETEAVNESKVKIAESDAKLLIAQAAADQSSKVSQEKSNKAIYDAKKDSELSKQRAEDVVTEMIEAEKKVEAANGQAKSIGIIAKAEADALILKFEAEAKGVLSVLEAKSTGYEKLAKSLGGAQNIAQIEMIEKMESIVALQMEAIGKMKIDKITVWDGGQSNGQGGGLKGLMKDLLTMGAPMHELAESVGMKLPALMGEVIKDPAKALADLEAKVLADLETKVSSENAKEKTE